MTKRLNAGVQRAIEIVGSQRKFAIATGYAQATVWKWLHEEQKVPAEIVPDIVELTSGKVLAHELRRMRLSCSRPLVNHVSL